MNHGTMTPFLILAALAWAVPSLHAAADDAAELVPADAAFYIRIDNLDELRAALAGDPLFEHLTARTPLAREPEAWEKLQAQMEMTGEQIIGRYFGQSVALVQEHGKKYGPSVLLSRVSEGDAARAVKRLELEELEEVGPFTLYKAADGKGRVAFSDRWMALGASRHADYMRAVLNHGNALSLADDERFRAALAELPEDPAVTLFTHGPDRDGVHAAALTRDGDDLTIHYAGQSPKISRTLAKVADREEFTYGPLPKETLAAVTLNMHDDDPSPHITRLLDRLLAPATFEEDVLPHLAAPVVLFLGETPADRIEPVPAFNAPVIGMAIRLRDRDVAAELDRAMDGVVLLANMAMMKWKTDPIDVRAARHNDTAYRVADFGAALSQRLDEPQYRGLARVAYGRVGDWYVVSSHEWFYRRCLDTLTDPDAGLERIERFDRLPIGEADQPVAAAWLRGADLAVHLRSILEHVQEAHPALFEAAERRGGWWKRHDHRHDHFAQRKHDRRHRGGHRGRGPKGPAGFIHRLSETADLLEAYQLIAAESRQGEEETLRARVHLLRR